jgi:hypothetical protein
MAATPTPAEIDRLLADWNSWLSSRTDSLLSLEDRVRSAGTDADVADVAAAFVARKAISDRLTEVHTTALRDRTAAVALTTRPLVDDLGGPVGRDLTDAATLLDAIVQRVEARVAGNEQQQVAVVRTTQQAESDLTVARKLAGELGMQVNHVAELTARLQRRDALADVAAEAATVRASLEAAGRERAMALQRWAELPNLLDRLAEREAAVRALADRCRAKVVQAPRLAVPSVAAVETQVQEANVVGLSGLPWVGARARVTPLITQIDRLGAALAEAERRFQQPLQRRDDLRGLLQAFADKANAGGVLETAELDGLYQQAKAVLWAAPADLDAADGLVQRYVAAVNAALQGAAR